LAKVTGPNKFSLAVGHRTTAKVDDCDRSKGTHFPTLKENNSCKAYNFRIRPVTWQHFHQIKDGIPRVWPAGIVWIGRYFQVWTQIDNVRLVVRSQWP